MILTEKELLKKLKSAKNVQLIEPRYPRKYPPLGLAKIATYLKKHKVNFTYARTAKPGKCDLVCVASLFTYYSGDVFDTLNELAFVQAGTPIIVGGVFASLMPEELEKRYPNIMIYRGYSKTLDKCPPANLEYHLEEPWDSFSYVFTSRGCPNKCPYCTVWRIEKERWVNPTWRDHIDLKRPNIMISDNNLSAVTDDHLHEIINFAVKHDKHVLFDNGFDCKHITKPMAKDLARLKFIRQGMRMAFDRIEEDGIFQKAVKILQKAGVKPSSMMAYVLFNFTDRPQDAYYRCRECDKLGVRPYPQYYRPLNTMKKKDKWVGKHWTLNLGRAFRHYWLMRGIYSKMSFEEYITNNPDNLKIKKKDLEMWKNNGVK